MFAILASILRIPALITFYLTAVKEVIKILEHYMRGSRKFCQKGSNFDVFYFLVDEGRDDPNTTKSGNRRPASKMPFKLMAQH